MKDATISSDCARDEEELRQSALDLRWALARKSCPCGSQGGCRCLLESLDQFHRHMGRHFDDEEREWSGSGDADWSSRARIDALIREHAHLRERLAAGLIALGDAHRNRRPLSPELAAEIRGVLDDLLQHELTESGVLQSEVLKECPRPHREG